MKQTLALDFGTTNSAFAIHSGHAGGSRTIEIPGLTRRNRAGDYLIPSLLYVTDGQKGEVLIGQEVVARGLERSQDNRLFFNFKRAIGAAPGSESVLDVRLIDGVQWTDRGAGVHFLRRLFHSLPYAPNEIEQLTITVPVMAQEGYSAWLHEVIGEYITNRIRIVDEATAAALGYAVAIPGSIILVIDIGGGSLDLSLIRLPARAEEEKDKVLVVAKSGARLGGGDIDSWLFTEILQRTGVNQDAFGDIALMLAKCEQAKITLSTEAVTDLNFQTSRGDIHTLPFTRDELEHLMTENGFFTSLQHALEKVMGLAHQKGVYREDIHHVLLLGGTALIPSVQESLDRYFRAITNRRRRIYAMPDWPALNWSVDNTTIHVEKPFTAVVEGALQTDVRGELEDRLGHGYALQVFDPVRKSIRFEEIIAAGSPYPSGVASTVILSGKGSIALRIGQIDGDSVVPINPEEPLVVRPSKKGLIRVSFRVNSLRRLLVMATDLQTGAFLLKNATVVDANSIAKPGGREVKGSSHETTVPTLVIENKRGRGWIAKIVNKLLPFLSIGRLSSGAMAEALYSEDVLLRFEAAKAIAAERGLEARQILEEVIAVGTAPQRASVVWNLWRASWYSAQPLLRQALLDKDERVREAAVFSLCKTRLPEAYRLVEDVLFDASDGIRLAAVNGLAEHPDASAVPVLALALKAHNPEVRIQAVEVLGETEALEALPIVRLAQEEADMDVKYAATLSWVELAKESCFPDLSGAIAGSSGTERRAVVLGFFHATNYLGIDVGQDIHAEVLLDALDIASRDPLPETRKEVCLPLAWIRHPRAETLLKEAFHRETDVDVKAHILSRAVHLNSPAASGMLEQALREESVVVRQTAEHLQAI